MELRFGKAVEEFPFPGCRGRVVHVSSWPCPPFVAPVSAWRGAIACFILKQSLSAADEEPQHARVLRERGCGSAPEVGERDDPLPAAESGLLRTTALRAHPSG